MKDFTGESGLTIKEHSDCVALYGDLGLDCANLSETGLLDVIKWIKENRPAMFNRVAFSRGVANKNVGNTIPVEVWKKKDDGTFFTETVLVSSSDFQGAYFYFDPATKRPSLVLNGGRIVVLKGGCEGEDILYLDEDARNE